MSTSTIPNHSQKQDDATTVIKLVYLSGGVGWNRPRSPAPQLLLDAGVPEAVWFATYDIAVERRNAFVAPLPKLQNCSWSEIFSFMSRCIPYYHITEWLAVVKGEQITYSAYGIKVMMLQTLTTSPHKYIIGGLQFNKVDNKIPQQRSFVQELEVLHRLRESGGLTDDEYTVAKQRVIHSNNETHESVVVVATAVESGASDINYFEANVLVEDEKQQSISMNEKENLLGG